MTEQTDDLEQEPNKDDEVVGKAVTIVRVNPENIMPIFINDFVISHSDTEFFMNFGVVEPPAVLSKEELLQIDTVNAITRVKVVITPAFAKKVLKTLDGNINTYEKKFGSEKNGES